VTSFLLQTASCCPMFTDTTAVSAAVGRRQIGDNIKMDVMQTEAATLVPHDRFCTCYVEISSTVLL
jgi:hypothetical protein